MNILQISTTDRGGGAERVSELLMDAYRDRGHQTWTAVGFRRRNDPGVLEIPNKYPGGAWGHLWLRLADRIAPLNGQFKGAGFALRSLNRIGYLPRSITDSLGHENFDFPGSRRILSMLPARPDIVQAHNLHGGYFDLRVLPELSARVPLLLTLHDAWLLSGHCAHSLGCERWQHGCGECPDLTIYPALERDGTGYNWRRKQEIFSRSRVYVSAPSRWLLDKVRRSILAPAMIEGRVIPNGVDTDVFRPSDRIAARRSLNLPEQEYLLLFAANALNQSHWKDFATLRDALAIIGESNLPRRVRLLALGGSGPDEKVGNAVLTFVPHEPDPKRVAAYFQAADLYLHAAKADTFPNVVIEALACGTPAVATAVCGIPEQILSFDAPGSDRRYVGRPEVATGMLTLPADARALAAATVHLLKEDAMRARLADNAARDAARRFSVDRQADAYLSWFEEITQSRKSVP